MAAAGTLAAPPGPGPARATVTTRPPGAGSGRPRSESGVAPTGRTACRCRRGYSLGASASGALRVRCLCQPEPECPPAGAGSAGGAPALGVRARSRSRRGARPARPPAGGVPSVRRMSAWAGGHATRGLYMPGAWSRNLRHSVGWSHTLRWSRPDSKWRARKGPGARSYYSSGCSPRLESSVTPSAGNIWTRAAWHAVMENYTAWCSVLTLSRVLIMAQLLVTER